MSTDDHNEVLLRDQAARDVVTTALDRNVMVIAGAGAGKTHALIERMVACIREGHCEIDEMAAITFTRKAAGEMRGRFYLQLRKEGDRVSDVDQAARIQSALAGIDQCFIGTIHSFCGRLLRERPVEAGLSPDFTEIDDRDEVELRRDVWDQFVQRRYAEGDVRLDELEDHGIDTDDLYAFFGRRCGNADVRVKPTHTPRPDLTPYVAEVRAFIDRVVPLIPANPERRDDLMKTVRSARHLVRNHGVESDKDAARLLRMFETSVDVTLKCWSDKDAARDIRDDWLPRLQERVITPGLRLWRECAYRLITDFVDEAVTYYDRVRHDEGKLTFQDLLLKTDEVLRTTAHVRSYFQRRYRSILVDEFQDTDPIQARILFYLTGDNVNEQDWRRLRPRTGSLFLVGDDKQSIYRFRRADVAVFRFVAQRIEETGGRVVHLNTSFRSLGRLCTWISDAFPSIFSVHPSSYQAAFKPLYEHRPAGADPHCVRQIRIPKVHRNRKEDVAAIDAERIAGFIAAAVDGRAELNESGFLSAKASAGDFLVLARTGTQLSVYTGALERRGIPFDVVGGGRLGESAEVQAVVTMLEAVYRPDDPVKFVAFLRGPLMGFSDAELYEYVRGGGSLRLGEPIPESAPDALRTRMEQAHTLLKSAEDELTRLPAAAAIERIIERSGLLGLSASHPDGSVSSRAGNLVRLLAIVRRRQARGWSWGRIVEDLREMIDDRSYKIEQMTLESGREDVVRVMNVHQAKGLQARVVFLADPYNLAHERDPDEHVSRSGDQAYLSMTVSKPRGEWNYEIVAQPEGWEQDVEEEKKYAAAEEARLLYVAATRAQDLLIVSTYPEKADRGPWSDLYTSLGGVPELEEPSPSGTQASQLPSISYHALCEQGRQRMARASLTSFDQQTVTGRRAQEDFEYGSREGRGPDYGVVIHRLFEEAVRGRLPAERSRYVRSVLSNEGLNEGLADVALDALDRLESSDLWNAIRMADEIYTEVPLGIHVDRDGRQGAVRGIIDLVYRNADGWHIVDYKTDRAPTVAAAHGLHQRYQSQLNDYETYWADVSGGRVASCDLWLVHGPGVEGQMDLF